VGSAFPRGTRARSDPRVVSHEHGPSIH
jgi:hypothetical protein